MQNSTRSYYYFFADFQKERSRTDSVSENETQIKKVTMVTGDVLWEGMR